MEALKERQFTFDEKKHRYELDGKPLTGVTTILAVIAKPALIQWSADMACNYIAEEWKKLDNGYVIDMPKLLAEARLAHRKKKEAAGDIGTIAHKQIEMIVIEAVKYGDGHLDKSLVFTFEDKQVEKMVNHFIKWAIDNKVKFIESEKRLYSIKHWFAGTCDLVFEMDGKRYIGDIKTSSGIYNEHFFQMGGYEIALEEMGYDKVDGYLVINLKKDGKFDLKVAENTEINKQAFLHALGLYKIINSLE